MKPQQITALDIGSSKICTLIALKDPQVGVLDVVGIGISPSFGLRKGVVADIEEVAKSINASVEEAERMSGLSANDLYVSLSGTHIESQNSKGVIAVSRADGEINMDDMDRVIEAARAVSIPSNREILHVIPKNFVIDGQGGIKDPIGMSGVRLEVETHIITGSTSAIRNLTKCIYQVGLDIEEMVVSILAVAKAVLTKKQKEIGVVLIDLGAATTDLIVFEEGDILHTACIPIGSNHITNDIAIGLRTSVDIAEKIKIEQGYAISEKISEREMIDLKKYGGEEKISRQYVAEIIEARLAEIFSAVQKELKRIGRDGMLPAGAVLTGGGSKLNGIVDSAKENLRLPVQLSKPLFENMTGLIDKLDDPIYTTTVGLLLYGVESEKHPFPGLKIKFAGAALAKVKKWFGHFLP